jgi:hypothetical protein
MNGLLGIWLIMRLVSWALLVFVLTYLIGDASLADAARAMIFIKPGLLVANPVAAAICGSVWLAWAYASWRFLFGK